MPDPDWRSLPELAVAPSFREQVLENLREQITAGELAPGSPLALGAVAARLGTSVMPVREALRVLEQEGLVEVSARRFTRVAAPRREVADEAYPLLGLLEGFALRQMVSMTHPALVEGRLANNDLALAKSIGEELRADVRFHRAITAGAGPTTRGVLSMLYARIALIEVGYHRTHPPDRSFAEHQAILGMLQERKPKAAARLIERHWQRGHAAIVPLLGEARDSLVATPRGRRG